MTVAACTHPEPLRGPLPYDGSPARADEWTCQGCGYVADHDVVEADPFAEATLAAADLLAAASVTQVPWSPLPSEVERGLRSTVVSAVPSIVPLTQEMIDDLSPAISYSTIQDALAQVGARYDISRAGHLSVGLALLEDTIRQREVEARIRVALRATYAARSFAPSASVTVSSYATDIRMLKEIEFVTCRERGEWIMSARTAAGMTDGAVSLSEWPPLAALFGRRVRLSVGAVADGRVERWMPLW